MVVKIIIMSRKITTKILLTLASIEIVFCVMALTPAKAQSTVASISISQESVNAATELSQQGKAKAEQFNYRGAIADFSKAIQLNPHEADFYYQRGLILRELSDRQAAIQDFDNAILRDPRHAWAYLQRAGVFFNLNISDRFRDDSSFTFRLNNIDRGDARAMLDLRTARDLFAQKGDKIGLQTADKLIQHFAGSLETEAKQNF